VKGLPFKLALDGVLRRPKGAMGSQLPLTVSRSSCINPLKSPYPYMAVRHRREAFVRKNGG
jgi:hypothetical protein